LANKPLALGNPNLEPERITSYELAFDYRWGLDEVINLNFFRYDWDSIIQYVPDSGASTSTAQNAGRQTGYGFELEAQRPVSDNLQLAANYAWQRSWGRVLNADAVGSPERQLYINAHWERDNWQIDLRGNWVMERNRAAGDEREPVEDYLLLDISLRRHISKHFQLALLVNNIGDVAAYEPSPNAEPQPFIANDLPLAGRSTFAEIRYAF
jgi:iron complex outermembrane receptor protein